MIDLSLLASDFTFADGLLVLVVGMVVIFLVLALVIFIVKGYVLLFKVTDKKGKNDAKPATEKKTVVVTENTDDDEEVVAAITAAIAAVYATESTDGEVPPFRVKSILLK